MLFVGTEKFIPEILEEHLEILGELWRRRPDFVRSTTDSIRRLGFFDERIEAHTDGLVVAGDDALPMLRDALEADEIELVVSAAYAFLKMQDEEITNQIWSAFESAEGAVLNGFRQVFCSAPLSILKKNLEPLAKKADSLHAAIALEALTFQNAMDPAPKFVRLLTAHENADVRRIGWRIVGMSDVEPPDFESGWNDADTLVQNEAALAAVWRQYQPVLDHCRQKAATQSVECYNEMLIFAILANPEDVDYLSALGRNEELGAARFRLLGSYGHPEVVAILLEQIANPDAGVVSAAGTAFMTITGRDIETDERAPLMPEDGSEPDEFEKEFLDDVALPSAELANSFWNQVKERFAKGKRWRRGVEVSEGASDDALELFDLESRWECLLRSRFQGKWDGRPQNLEKLIPNEPIC